MKIIVLHADASQAAGICQALNGAGHACQSFGNGKDTLAQLRREPCELLLLDWPPQAGDAAEVLHWVRDKLVPGLPVLLLCINGEHNAIATGLHAGADDYLIKPIRRQELATRVQTLLLRAYPGLGAAELVRFGDYVFDAKGARLSLAGAPIALTYKEFALAMLFFQHLGKPLSRAYILEEVWPGDIDLSSRTMDTHVSRVRSKLQLLPERGFRLAPVYSYGYRLEQLAGRADGKPGHDDKL